MGELCQQEAEVIEKQPGHCHYPFNHNMWMNMGGTDHCCQALFGLNKSLQNGNYFKRDVKGSSRWQASYKLLQASHINIT